MTGPPAPDDRLLGNGQPESESGADHPGDDPLGAQRARLAGFWALVQTVSLLRGAKQRPGRQPGPE